MVKRQPKIRLDAETRKEYSRLANSAKAKIKRINKNYGVNLRGHYDSVLDDTISVPKLEDFNTRSEFNKWKETMSSFTNRNNQRYQFVKNEYNVVTTKSQIHHIETDIRRAQANADRVNAKLKDLETQSGSTVASEMQQMARPNIGMSRPKDFNFGDVRNQQRLKNIAENMKRKSDPDVFTKRQQAFKSNYIEQLQEAFNSDADKLVYLIENIPDDDFYQIYAKNQVNLEFDLFYTLELEGENYDGRVKELESYMEAYLQGKMNLDLKNF